MRRTNLMDLLGAELLRTANSTVVRVADMMPMTFVVRGSRFGKERIIEASSHGRNCHGLSNESVYCQVAASELPNTT